MIDFNVIAGKLIVEYPLLSQQWARGEIEGWTEALMDLLESEYQFETKVRQELERRWGD